LAVNTAGIGLRWIESHQMGIGYAPLSNMYESLVFFAWSIAVVYLWLELPIKTDFSARLPCPLPPLAMGLAEMKNPEIRPLMPALQSNWLIAHVVTCFIGYAAFAVACGFGSCTCSKQHSANKAGKFPGAIALHENH
jgi:ABC-type transport system involved in cytochrome c biogenesis permease subunit